jgi:hypothetical protein
LENGTNRFWAASNFASEAYQQPGAFVCASAAQRAKQQLSLELEQFKFIAQIISQS